MYSLTSPIVFLTLSVALSGVQCHIPHRRHYHHESAAPLVCHEDNQLRALERFSHFADEFCPEFLAKTGKYPRWLDHWNKKEVSSACSCYEKTAMAHGVTSTIPTTGTLSLSSTAPVEISEAFATTSSSGTLLTTSTASIKISEPFPTSSATGAFFPSVTGSISGGVFPTTSATGGFFPSMSGSVSGGYFPSGSASGGYFPSGSVFGSSGSIPVMTGTAPIIASPASSSSVAIASANMSTSAAVVPTSSTPAAVSTSASPIISEGASSASSSAIVITSANASTSAAVVSTSSAPAVLSTSASPTISEGASVTSSIPPYSTNSLPAEDLYPPQPPGAGPGKRGLVYDIKSQDGWSTLFEYSKYVTYGSNWAVDRSTQLDESFSYVPTIAVDADLNNDDWNSTVPVLIEGGTKALFASNEPDNADQANLTPQQAATVYKKYMMPHVGTVQLGTPAVTNGDGQTGLTFLENFMTHCTDCRFNFINVHYYLQRSDVNTTQYAQALKDYIDITVPTMQAKYPQLKGLPIFIGEWWLWNASLEEGADLMDELLPYLDNNPRVLAYQAFGGLWEGNFISADLKTLTPAGQKYNNWTAAVTS